ncbi:hypothetical protein WR25_19185 [Diploscapter pachys]|uniref:WH1 domain-containing protein n=1 Tax=Diploscapter pachys TaxID=2018661 RepID=A0A2A2JEV9_9BILA|nr:hypothetical protein WR25_19185 [Diploscapter pachys]
MSALYPPGPSIGGMMTKNGGAQQDRKRKRPPNSGSILLENQENQMLFGLLGSDNVSLSAGVVELLEARNHKWNCTNRGVVSLVKDYRNRAYFIRLFDILEGHQLWEFRLYRGFELIDQQHCANLLTFETELDGHVYGLNFSSGITSIND